MPDQPGLPGSQFPGPDQIVRELRELRRAVQQFAAANVLATAGISAAEGGVMVNGFMQFKREDGTLGVQVDPVTGTFTAYDAAGTTAVARFGALTETALGEYGVEVLVSGTWVQLGAQVATWSLLAGKPVWSTDASTIAGGYIAGSVAHTLDSDRTDHADGVTPEAFDRVVGGVPGTWYEMYMHSNGTLGRGTSSQRYKKNVRGFTLTAEQLLALRPVVYDRKAVNPENGSIADDYTPAVSVDELGLIAEEVEQVAPELVEYFEDQVDNVKYHLIGVALLPLVQEHQRIITEQAEDIAALKQAVHDLGGNI